MSVLALFLVNLGIAACLIAFCAPFWVINHSILAQGADLITDFTKNIGIGNLGKFKHEGLWGSCSEDMICTGVWENDFMMEKNFEGNIYIKYYS